LAEREAMAGGGMKYWLFSYSPYDYR